MDTSESRRSPPPAVPTERRTFLRASLFLVGSLVMWPWGWARAKKIGIRRASVAGLNDVGGSAVIKVKGQELLIVRDTEATVRVLDPTCTHKKCQVRYQPETRDIGCRCHKSKFMLDGKVVSGPAPRPLTTFEGQLTEDQIIITLPE